MTPVEFSLHTETEGPDGSETDTIVSKRVVEPGDSTTFKGRVFDYKVSCNPDDDGGKVEVLNTHGRKEGLFGYGGFFGTPKELVVENGERDQVTSSKGFLDPATEVANIKHVIRQDEEQVA